MKNSVLLSGLLVPFCFLLSTTELKAQCPPGEDEVIVNIDTDDFAAETSWVFADFNTNMVVASGNGLANNSSNSIPYCLPPGDYIFTIFDSYGDGICCGFGMGSYSVEVNGGILISGGDFGASETSPVFTIAEPLPDPTVNISDPCVCGNPNNIMVNAGDDPTDPMLPVAYFAEVVTIDAAPGATFVIDNLTGAFDNSGNAITTVTFMDTGMDADGDLLNEHTATFWHEPTTGYTLDATVDGIALDATNACVDCAPVVLAEVPTLSQWGLIFLALMLMAFGALRMGANSIALSAAGNTKLTIPVKNPFRLPYNKAIFYKSMLFTGILALIGFTICFAIYGAIFMPDIIGVALAGPVFAYLIHLLYLIEKG